MISKKKNIGLISTSFICNVINNHINTCMYARTSHTHTHTHTHSHALSLSHTNTYTYTHRLVAHMYSLTPSPRSYQARLITPCSHTEIPHKHTHKHTHTHTHILCMPCHRLEWWCKHAGTCTCTTSISHTSQRSSLLLFMTSSMARFMTSWMDCRYRLWQRVLS